MTANRWYGRAASPGRASGPVWHAPIENPEPRPPRRYPMPEDVGSEAARVRAAADLVAAALRDAATFADGPERAGLEQAAAMAGDPSLLSTAEELVRAENLPAARAVWDAAQRFVAGLEELPSGPAAEWADILRIVRDRLIEELTGSEAPGISAPGEPSVLVFHVEPEPDALPTSNVLAIVTAAGDPSSRLAVFARTHGIPAVVGCTPVSELTGAVLVDGNAGFVEPATDTAPSETASAPAPAWSGRGATRDGTRVPLLADIDTPDEVPAAREARAEGLGMLRTEFCYLATDAEPSVEDQAQRYRTVLAWFHGKPCTVRTLEAGADQPVTWPPPSPEPNPALGSRGFRATRGPMLDNQLAALAATGVPLSVVAPTIGTREEAEDFAARARAVGVRAVGVVVEVPAAAITADMLFDVVDFVTIDLDRLTQYTMAADRELPELARLADPWQPAVLRLVERTVRAGDDHRKPVGVCGRACADPELACTLVGLGVASISAPPAALAAIGATLVRHRFHVCHTAARAALGETTAAGARAAARRTFTAPVDPEAAGGAGSSRADH